MIKISRSTISVLRPCKDRLDNYVKHYADREFTPRQFMGLKHITHKDKLWVAFRSLNQKSISLACADIAESVLHIYEKRYPNDKRPRDCIEAVRLYANGNITRETLLERRKDAAAAAYAAAYDAYAAAAAYAASSRSLQEKLCRTILLRYWK